MHSEEYTDGFLHEAPANDCLFVQDESYLREEEKKNLSWQLTVYGWKYDQISFFSPPIYMDLFAKGELTTLRLLHKTMQFV